MIYVEALRLRRTLAGFAIPLVALWVLAVGLDASGVSRSSVSGVDLSDLVVVGVFYAMLVASFLGGSLNRENATLPVAWTRPASRASVAVAFFTADLAAIALTVIVTTALVVLAVVAIGFGGAIRYDAGAPGVLAYGITAALLWYAVVQLVAAPLPPGRPGLVGGLSWPVFLLLLWAPSWSASPAWRALTLVLNVPNPLAWFGGRSAHAGASYTFGANAPAHALFASVVPPPLLWAMPALLAAAALAGALLLWQRHEVSR